MKFINKYSDQFATYSYIQTAKFPEIQIKIVFYEVKFRARVILFVLIWFIMHLSFRNFNEHFSLVYYCHCKIFQIIHNHGYSAHPQSHMSVLCYDFASLHDCCPKIEIPFLDNAYLQF